MELAEMYDEALDHNAEVFKEYFSNVEKWVEEYTESDDYLADYITLLNESCNISTTVEKMLRPCEYPSPFTHDSYRSEAKIFAEGPLPKSLAGYVVNAIVEKELFTIVSRDQYDSFRGWTIESFQDSEYEEQIEVSAIEKEVIGKLKWMELRHGEWVWKDHLTRHEFLTALSMYLDRQRDFCFSFFRSLADKYSTIHMVVYLGKRIDFDVSAEQWEQATTEGMIEYCQIADWKRKERLQNDQDRKEA